MIGVFGQLLCVILVGDKCLYVYVVFDRNTWTAAAQCGQTETSRKPLLRLTRPGEVICTSPLLGVQQHTQY